MHQASTRAGGRQLAAVTGTARWRGLGPTRHTLDMGCGWLSITTAQGVRSDFWVRAFCDDAGKLVGYRLTRWDPDTGAEDGTVYDIDISFTRDDYRGWDCTCPDHCFSSHRRPDRACKHTRSLAAALQRVNLL